MTFMKAAFVRASILRCIRSVLMAAALSAATGTAFAQRAYISTSPIKSGAPFAVSIIDMVEGKLAGKITVEGAAGAVALTPDGAKILVADGVAGQLSIVDTRSHAVEARIPAPYVRTIAVTPDGSKAYVATGANDILVIDLAHDAIVKYIRYPGNAVIAIAPNGTKAYVTDGQFTVAAIDTITDTIGAKIYIPGPGGNSISWPIDIAFLPNGSKAYVANYQNNDVSVIDTKTDKVVATIPTGRLPDSIAVAADGKKVYVAQSFASQVSVIDPATNTVTSNAKVTHPYGITLGPDGLEAYVTSDNAILVLSTSTLKVVQRIAVGGQPDITKVAIGQFPFILTATTSPTSGVATLGGSTATRASLTNNWPFARSNCRAEIAGPSAQGVQMLFRAIDAKGKPEGKINQPVTIQKNGTQAFRLAFSGDAPRAGGPIPVIFECDTYRAPTVTDLNTFDLSLTAAATANILVLKPAPNDVVTVPVNGDKAFIVNADNVGSGDVLTVSMDSGNAPLPLSLSVCPVKAGTAACGSPAAASFTGTFAAKQTQRLLVTVHAANFIALAPTASRIFVRFKDRKGALRGLTSIAVQTQAVDPKNPPVPGPTYSGSFSGMGTSFRSGCQYSNAYSGSVKISLAPGSRTGTASVNGTLTRTLQNMGDNCSFGTGTQSITASAPITLSASHIDWAAVASDSGSVFYASGFNGTLSKAKITGTLTEHDVLTAGSTNIKLSLPASH